MVVRFLFSSLAEVVVAAAAEAVVPAATVVVVFPFCLAEAVVVTDML